jgi:ribosomal protein S18 acetylase RimI-like enzyme
MATNVLKSQVMLRRAAALDLLPRLNDPALRDVLSLAVGDPTEQKIDVVCAIYREMHDWKLFGYCDDRGGISACIGIEITGADEATIQHLAVLPAMRGQGIAKMLLHHICEALNVTRLKAETDSEAVGFYKKCGFQVESQGEVYPGVERFLCCLDIESRAK